MKKNKLSANAVLKSGDAMEIAEKKSTAPVLDADEAPQSRHRKKLAKERTKRIAETKSVETWYEQSGKKIIQKTKMSNGSVHSLFVGMINKKNKDQVAELKSKYGITITG
jgi:hypothetical protein